MFKKLRRVPYLAIATPPWTWPTFKFVVALPLSWSISATKRLHPFLAQTSLTFTNKFVQPCVPHIPESQLCFDFQQPSFSVPGHNFTSYTLLRPSFNHLCTRILPRAGLNVQSILFNVQRTILTYSKLQRTWNLWNSCDKIVGKPRIK